MNLKKLRESSSIGVNLDRMSTSTQSQSVGTHLTSSPLDAVPRTSGTNSDEEAFVSDSEEVDFHDSLSNRSGYSSRSRSLTLPPSAPVVRKPQSRLESPGGVAVSKPNTSPSRVTSEPIQISQPPKNRLNSSGHVPFPLTDGALAEYAALSCTPQSNPNIRV